MRLRRRAGRTTVVAAALASLLLAAPAPAAAARVVVTVEVAYGGIVVGGVGFFLYFAGSWEIPFGPRDLPTSLLEVQGDRLRFGVPLPLVGLDALDASVQQPDGPVLLELVRWRF